MRSYGCLVGVEIVGYFAQAVAINYVHEKNSSVNGRQLLHQGQNFFGCQLVNGRFMNGYVWRRAAAGCR